VASSRADFIAVKRACRVEVNVAGVCSDGSLDSQDALSIEVFGDEGNGQIGRCAEAAAGEGGDQDLRKASVRHPFHLRFGTSTYWNAARSLDIIGESLEIGCVLCQ